MTSPAARSILVVTPTLGDSPFLDQTVRSVRAHPGGVHHVMVAPAGIVASLQQRYPHAEVMPDAGRAAGLYGALNVALTGTAYPWEWFTYINDDDTLLPGFGSLAESANRTTPPADVLYGDVELIDEGGRCISRITIERNPAWIPALLQQGISPLMQQGMLFRRTVVNRLRGFDTRYRLCADLDFWLRAYVHRARFHYHPQRVAQFRLRPGQLSGNTLITDREQRVIVSRHLPELLPAFKRRVACWRYRWCNLPRYVARVRSRGFQTSYELLQTEGAPR